MFCSHCGIENLAEAKICLKCGRYITMSQPHAPGDKLLTYDASFLSFKGSMGRIDYFINILKIWGIWIGIAMIWGFLSASLGEHGADTATVIMIVPAIAALAYGFFANTSQAYRRIKDIRGTASKAAPITVVTYIAAMIPYLNFFIQCGLLFWPGQAHQRALEANAPENLLDDDEEDYEVAA